MGHGAHPGVPTYRYEGEVSGPMPSDSSDEREGAALANPGASTRR